MSDDDYDAITTTAASCRVRKRPAASQDKTTTTPRPVKAKRPRRRPEVVRANQVVKAKRYRKNDEVEVLYEDVWWKAKILFMHRGTYAVRYYDDNCEEDKIPASRIRPRK